MSSSEFNYTNPFEPETKEKKNRTGLILGVIAWSCVGLIIGISIYLNLIVRSSSVQGFNSIRYEYISISIGILCFASVIIAIVGIIFSIIEISRIRTPKTVVGLIINLLYVIIFIALIAINLSDIF